MSASTAIEKAVQAQKCEDILKKLKQTNQTYIIGYDIPISVSQYIYELLELRRKQLARRLDIPEEQYEFEDLFLYYFRGTE